MQEKQIIIKGMILMRNHIQKLYREQNTQWTCNDRYLFMFAASLRYKCKVNLKSIFKIGQKKWLN